MRLQKLEIKGFKSFANETVIHFNESVTGIIGPNGSGKSNIVDAIRWVLGEQKTKELRLEKMSSVLFNGTRKRKASGTAQVTLTFDNTKNLLPTEYQNVAISRTLYRTGESEYRINGVSCRLKDISSLFMDTGIGSNSYAIIALSMVDEILNDNEGARRKMIEEAAGISKYKKRKSETLRKLSNTDADLSRVDDLLFEIESNLKSLEKQANKAKKYLDTREEYKVLSLEFAVIQSHELKTRYRQIESQLNKEDDRLRELEISLRKAESKIEQEKLLNLDKEKVLSERQKNLNAVVLQIRNGENQVDMLQQRKNFIEQNQSKLEERMRFHQSRIEQLSKDISYFQTNLQNASAESKKGEIELREAEQDMHHIRQQHSNIKADMDVFLSELQRLEKGVYELEKQKAINLNQIENLFNEVDRNKSTINLRTSELDGLRKSIGEVSIEEDRLSASVANLEQQDDLRVARIREKEEHYQKANQDLAIVNRQLDALRNEYKLTKSMIENLEGFPESIKYLSQHEEFGKKHLLLSDVMSAPEKYRIPIEHFLDQYLNYYILPDFQIAQQAIQLLRNNQKGKANFFVLSALAKTSFNTPEVDGLIRALDLVECEPVYQPLMAYLFHNVYLKEDDHLDTDGTQWDDIILLGSNGSWTLRKFSLSGGSVGLFEGKKLGRKKNLDQLDKQIRKLEIAEAKGIDLIQNLKEELSNLKKANQPSRIKEEKVQLNQIIQQRITLSTRMENVELYLNETGKRSQQALDQIEILKVQNTSLDQELVQQKAGEYSYRTRMEETDQSYKAAAEALNARSTAYNERNIRYIQLQNKVKSIEQELQFREKQVQESEKSLETDRKSEVDAKVEMANVLSELDKLQTSLIGLYDDKKSKEAVLNEAEQTYFSTRGSIHELESDLRLKNRERQEAQVLVNELKEQYNNIRLELTSIGERLKVEFKTSIQEIINKEPDPDLDPIELENKILRLRNRLENYGEVNPMAVEAYNEMKARFDTIDQQRKDIVQAKNDLLTTITEIEETATKQFMEAFNQVKSYFVQVFRSLFTGDDTADLILEEPDIPLESKIQIIAKPKGKRPQSINQLSGGEKTLTATALLFSLYLLKPAPFCIFDEVDAPLDDSNIEKFNRIIKKFSENSQFIIVTHNKMTMAAVDVLYGVFMREQGISAVAAVDFRTYDHNAIMETVTS